MIVNKRLNACPRCMPFAGKVFIDDVWGGGTAADGDYPLLSEAVAAGLYHPRCKDSHTAYFPGITDKPKKYTKAEVKEAEKAEEQERKADYAERQAEKYQRVADTRLDPENKKQEQVKADRWDEFQSENNSDDDIYKAFRLLTKRTEDLERMSDDALKIASTKDITEQMKAIESLLDKYIKNPSQWSGKVVVDDKMTRWGSHNRITHDITLRSDSPLKTKFHELIHARTIFQNNAVKNGIIIKFKPLNEAITEVVARGICKAEGIQVLNLSYPELVRNFRSISFIMGVDELKFGLSLIEIPFEKRYDWIKGMLDSMKNRNELSTKDYNEANNCLQALIT